MASPQSAVSVWIRRAGLVAVSTAAGIFWVLGLYSGAWAVRQLGPATLGNRTLVFGQAAGPWFSAGGLLTVTLAALYLAIRRPAGEPLPR